MRRGLRSSNRDLLVLSGIVALCVSIALAVDLLTYKGVGYDLAAYILAARRLVAGEALYPAEMAVLGPAGQFVYPPPVALLFVPLAPLPFDPVRAAALVVLAALGALLAFDLARRLPLQRRYWAAAGAVMFFPLVWEVSLENLTLVSLMFCLAAWKARNASRVAGVGLAAGVGLKLLPLALLAFFLAARRGRILMWALAAAAAVVMLSWPVVGAEWPSFLSLLAHIGSGPPGSGSNIVPAIFSAPPLRPVLPALAIGIALLCGSIARAGGEREEHAFRVALAAAPLLAATLWYPYLIFALPLLCASAPVPPRPVLRAPFMVARPAAWLLMQAQVVKDPGRDFVLPLVGLLLLLIVGLLELRWPTAARSSEAGTADRSASARAVTAALSSGGRL